MRVTDPSQCPGSVEARNDTVLSVVWDGHAGGSGGTGLTGLLVVRRRVATNWLGWTGLATAGSQNNKPAAGWTWFVLYRSSTRK